MDLMIFKPVVNKVVGRLLVKPEDVEDFKQEAFLKLCQVAAKLPSEEEEAKKSNWKNYVYTCVLNRLLDVSNKNRKHYFKTRDLQRVSRLEKKTFEIQDDFQGMLQTFLPEEREILKLQMVPSPEYVNFLYGYKGAEDCKGFSFAIQEFLQMGREQFIEAVKSIYLKASRFKMLTELETKNKPLCFGEMYDDLIGVCKDVCALRQDCKKLVMAKLGTAKTRKKINHETKKTWRNLMLTQTAELSKICDLTQHDSFTQEIMAQFYDFGFTPFIGKSLISFRIGEKRMFSLVKKNAEKGIDSCLIGVAIRRRDFYPDYLQRYISKNVEGIFPYLSVSSIEDLREFLSGFIREFLLDEEVENEERVSYPIERGVESPR